MELTPRNYYGFVNTMQSLAGETFISPAFLMEDEELTKAIKSGVPFEALLEYINENF